ncbi:hypothetical protein [Flavobacterium hungaricum]|uniref:Tissue inhibitor of metalloproteinase n=1 Tax=Flavobacterium hungaricum TaxID=2082725 RepID=A0ABR9TMD1_9FLAO|nr:hypothetical protein [Flavobacterium hungaricum]MBE8725797.1 hypothetical protein [Flavobacterium hungaricum]
MKKTIISLIFLLCWIISNKAQSISTADSLEKTVIDFLDNEKTNNYTISHKSVLVITYSIPFNKYIVCLKGIDKLCKESSSSIYKIAPTKTKNLYFSNNFIPSIKIDEENIHYFFTDEECKDEEGVIRTSIIVMLLIDNNFSIIKEVRGYGLESLKEDLLCPTSPESIERARVKKKYGKLQ